MGLRQSILIRELKESLARLEGRSDVGQPLDLKEEARRHDKRVEEAEAIKKLQKAQRKEFEKIGERLGLSEAGAKAFARGRYRG